ncbi:MAG: CPBP family intramembrane metalloprotease [Bacilli bacterium]|nr:CPBP family intramembrane metalloprotease [Bacilli bacterium]
MKEKSIFLKVALLAFVPSFIAMLLYAFLGKMQNSIPSLLLFLICVGGVLFPFEIYVIRKNDKKLFNKSDLKWWQLVLIVGLLFSFAGLMMVIVTPLEHSLFSNQIDKLNKIIPAYFSWDSSNLINYSNVMVIITCLFYFLLNVIVYPVIEEFFFRGVLTNKLERYGYLAPIFVTVVFSLYHFWLPFDNLFRIAVFILPSLLAYKYKDIRISIGFHCICNLFSTIIFILGVL